MITKVLITMLAITILVTMTLLHKLHALSGI